jgi:hypothetical protein
MVQGRKTEFAKVNKTKDKKGYIRFSINLPIKIGQRFCFKNGQELKINETSEFNLLLSPKREEKPNSMTFMKQTLEDVKDTHPRKRIHNKIETPRDIQLQREILYIETHIGDLKDIIKKDYLLIKAKKTQLAGLLNEKNILEVK